jgi:charged multivesicular body protein 2A
MGLLTWLFGKPLTPTQLVRKNQRAINKAIRNLDRERFKMEQQEKKLIVDVKNSAKAGQMVSF